MKKFELSDLNPGSHIHFIGIGGISMSGLAVILAEKGYKISGSDRTKSSICQKLEDKGIIIYEGHNAKNIEGADLVVHTAAVHMDNPEMAEAVNKGIHLIDRAECLGAIMKLYKNAIGISGTHGKTTTTALLTHALLYAETDPTISIGGELDIIGGNIRAGKSDYFVTEACEYTNSFLKFFPYIAVITNIEEDHLDFFSGIEQIRESFASFAALTKDDGYVVAYGDDENIRLCLKDSPCRIVYYGKDSSCDYYPENIQIINGFPQFDVFHNGNFKVHVNLNVPGYHNIMNSLSVIAVCDLLGIDADVCAKGLQTYKGTHRRFEKLGKLNGADIIADYAHHPTEIKATLKTAKAFSPNRLWCVFQPHTYTRTRTLWDSFLTCFEEADKLILTHIYAAREQFDGITRASDLSECIRSNGSDCIYIEDFSDIIKHLKENVLENDMVFIMGAGDIIQIGNELVENG